MAGIFDIKKGAFDSSEASVLHEAYEIALRGLKAKVKSDQSLGKNLALFIVKVARTEPDCLRNDGTIDPAKLAQRAIQRMLQTKSPNLAFELGVPSADTAKPGAPVPNATDPESPGKVMLRIFERTPFAKV